MLNLGMWMSPWAGAEAGIGTRPNKHPLSSVNMLCEPKNPLSSVNMLCKPISSSAGAAEARPAVMAGPKLQTVPMWYLTRMLGSHIQVLGFARQTFLLGTAALSQLAKVLPASTKGKEKRKTLRCEASQPCHEA